uniref:GH16 domain-containing protein n=1 Tax=Bionectria ochroleuca TaxID=29856 RepID=A0A8H7NQY7_BIOOC
MLSKSLFAALALVASASAQTYTDCDPTKKDCPAAPALGNKKISCDYTKGDCSDFTKTYDFDYSLSADKGAKFRIDTLGQAPTIASSKWIFFGRIDVVCQAAPGVGVITSVVLQSADLDEIDLEWVGGDDYHVQTNYFGKGDTSSWDRGGIHDVYSPLRTSTSTPSSGPPRRLTGLSTTL